MINSNHIAIFQKDCIMFNMFDDIFLEYDFGGANYYLTTHLTFFNGGVNGGFSLRKKDKMIECLKKVNLEIINKYKREMSTLFCQPIFLFKNINEDVFFVWACEILKFKIPDVFHRKKLAIEFEIEIHNNNNNNKLSPSVYHGWHHNYHSVYYASQFLTKSEYFAKVLYV
jgi:hypothetical protein